MTLWRWFQQHLAPQRAYIFLTKLSQWSGWFALIVLPIALGWSLYGVPADWQQGDGFRILYVHVPCAFLSLALYAVLGISALLYLIWSIKVFHALGQSVAYVGSFFTLLALITGSLWGKPMWGTWWVWDARLTSEFILLCLFMSYQLLSSVMSGSASQARVCAWLAVFGLIDLPIIHYSVLWWHTLHQGPSLLQGGQRVMALVMQYPLWVMLCGFVCLSVYWVSQRMRYYLLCAHQQSGWVQQC